MARYSDEFRAQAIMLLEMNGYPETKGALLKTAKYLGIPQRTLSRWARRQSNPPPDILVHKKNFDLQQAIKDELQAIVYELPLARPDADYRELGTIFAILVDKLQLLEGKATERVEHFTPAERIRRIAELYDAARNRRDGSAADIVQ